MEYALVFLWFAVLVIGFFYLVSLFERLKRRFGKPCECKTPERCNFYDRCMK